MKRIIIFILALVFLLPIGVDAKEKTINMYLFYGKECPHCEKEIEFLNEYLSDKGNIRLNKYEVWYSSDNQELLKKASSIMNVEAGGVPYLIIGSKVIRGYMDVATPKSIENAVNYYLTNPYKDVFGEEMGYVEKTYIDPIEHKDDNRFTIPLLGEIDAKSVSLPLVALIIGFVDGFNPCAMWILIFLISMLFGMKNKKKMWILGGTFILTSGVIYLLFMLSWLNFAEITSKVVIVRLLIGLFALIFGGINVYRYIKSLNEKEVGCDVTTSNKRMKIMDKIKRIVTENSFILALLGIIILAASVNLIELLCSLGLPVVFTQILSMNELSSLQYVIYMGIYIFFFLVDDIIIFMAAMKTSEIKAISNRYAKYSHLIGGIIMLMIGILMIFKPEWLMFNF